MKVVALLFILIAVPGAISSDTGLIHKHRRLLHSYSITHDNIKSNNNCNAALAVTEPDEQPQSVSKMQESQLDLGQLELQPEQSQLQPAYDSQSQDLWSASSQSSSQSILPPHDSADRSELVGPIAVVADRDFFGRDSDSDNDKTQTKDSFELHYRPRKRVRNRKRPPIASDAQIPSIANAGVTFDPQPFLTSGYVDLPGYQPMQPTGVIVVANPLDTNGNTYLVQGHAEHPGNSDLSTIRKGIYYGGKVTDSFNPNAHVTDDVIRIIPDRVQETDSHLVGTKIRVAPSVVHHHEPEAPIVVNQPASTEQTSPITMSRPVHIDTPLEFNFHMRKRPRRIPTQGASPIRVPSSLTQISNPATNPFHIDLSILAQFASLGTPTLRAAPHPVSYPQFSTHEPSTITQPASFDPSTAQVPSHIEAALLAQLAARESAALNASIHAQSPQSIPNLEAPLEHLQNVYTPTAPSKDPSMMANAITNNRSPIIILNRPLPVAVYQPYATLQQSPHLVHAPPSSALTNQPYFSFRPRPKVEQKFTFTARPIESGTRPSLDIRTLASITHSLGLSQPSTSKHTSNSQTFSIQWNRSSDKASW